MKDKDWRTLIYSINQGNCILVLGPEISFPFNDPLAGTGIKQFSGKTSITVPEMLANKLASEIRVTNLDPFSLAQVAEFYGREFGRNDLEMEAISFFREAPPSDVYADLAKIPFNLIISLDINQGLVKALGESGREPVVETYDFRGDQKAFVGIGRDGVGTAEQPLVYNLCGSLDTPQSLVLSESDTLDFLSAILSGTPELPSDLRSQLRDPNKSFLLLGFGLTRWYLRILLHVLRVNKRETRSFALEKLSTSDQTLLQQTILFMKKGLRMESFDVDVDSFARELATRAEAAGVTVAAHEASESGTAAGGPHRATPLLDAPKIFISYAKEDESAANRLYEELKDSGLDPWFDKKGLRGGDRWDEVIREAVDEVDYFVVLQSTALGEKTFSYVNREIDLALERQQFARRGIRYLIPTSIDDSPPLEELKHLQAIDLANNGGSKELVSTILRDQQRRKKRAAA